jgi:predicted peptidase
MKFTIGDTVRFLDEPGQAVVRGFGKGNQVLIEDESGFDYEIDASKLVPVNPETETKAYRLSEEDITERLLRNTNENVRKSAENDFKIKYKNPEATNVQRKGEVMEVDLHMHELVDDETGLDDGEKRDLQMRHFERMMRIAEEKKIPNVVFIHGIGQGVLRALIRKTLNDFYPNCSFHDADYRIYGQGATEVRIRYSGR